MAKPVNNGNPIYQLCSERSLEMLLESLSALAKPLPASDTFSTTEYTDQLLGAIRVSMNPSLTLVANILESQRYCSLYKELSAIDNKTVDEKLDSKRQYDETSTPNVIAGERECRGGAWVCAIAILDVLLAIHLILVASNTPEKTNGDKGNTDISTGQAAGSEIESQPFSAYSGLIQEIDGGSQHATANLIQEIEVASFKDESSSLIPLTLTLSQSIVVRQATRFLIYAVVLPLLPKNLSASLDHYMPQISTGVNSVKNLKSTKGVIDGRSASVNKPLCSKMYNELYGLAGETEVSNERLGVVIDRLAVWMGSADGQVSEVTHITNAHFCYPVIMSVVYLAYGDETKSAPSIPSTRTPTCTSPTPNRIANFTVTPRQKHYSRLLVLLRHRIPLDLCMESMAQLLGLRTLPRQLRRVCSKTLTDCLMMRNGVRCLLLHLMSNCETIGDVRAAATQAMRLIVACPTWMINTQDRYYSNVCAQLCDLLHLQSGNGSGEGNVEGVNSATKRLPHAVILIIHGFILNAPSSAEKHLVSRICSVLKVRYVKRTETGADKSLGRIRIASLLDKPDDECWEAEINIPAPVRESKTKEGVEVGYVLTRDAKLIERAIQFTIEDLHKVFVAGISMVDNLNTNEEKQLLNYVVEYVPILLSLYSFCSRTPAAALKTSVSEVLGKVLKSLDEGVVVNSFLEFLNPTPGKTKSDLKFDGSESKQTEGGGENARKSANNSTFGLGNEEYEDSCNSEISYTTFDLVEGSRGGVVYKRVPQSDRNFQLDCQCVVELLGTLKRTTVAGDFFVRLVEEIGAVADEDHTEEHPESVESNFLNGGGNMTNAEVNRKERYLMLLQCLMQLVQALDVSIIKRTRHVITFAKLLATSADNETTCMALGLLTTVLNGQAVEIKHEDECAIAELHGWLEPFTHHPTPAVSEMALDLLTNIQTRNSMWDGLHQVDNVNHDDMGEMFQKKQHASVKHDPKVETTHAHSIESSERVTESNMASSMGLLPDVRSSNGEGNVGGNVLAMALVTETETLSTALQQLRDPMLPVRAHALVLLRRLMETNDESVQDKDGIIFDVLITQIRQPDSYIYLAAIQAMIVLCLSAPANTIHRVCDSFIDAKGKMGESVQSKLGEVLYGVAEAGHTETTTQKDGSVDTKSNVTQDSYRNPNASREKLQEKYLSIVIDAVLIVADTNRLVSYIDVSSTANSNAHRSTKTSSKTAENKSVPTPMPTLEQLLESGMAIASALSILARICELRGDVTYNHVLNIIKCVEATMCVYGGDGALSIDEQAADAEVPMVTVLSTQNVDGGDSDDDEEVLVPGSGQLTESDLPMDVQFPGMKMRATDCAEGGDKEGTESKDSMVVLNPRVHVRRGAMHLAVMLFRGYNPYYFGLMAPHLPPVLTLIGKTGTVDHDPVTRAHAQVALDDANHLFNDWVDMVHQINNAGNMRAQTLENLENNKR
eukprot:CFRG3941T1